MGGPSAVGWRRQVRRRLRLWRGCIIYGYTQLRGTPGPACWLARVWARAGGALASRLGALDRPVSPLHRWSPSRAALCLFIQRLPVHPQAPISRRRPSAGVPVPSAARAYCGCVPVEPAALGGSLKYSSKEEPCWGVALAVRLGPVLGGFAREACSTTEWSSMGGLMGRAAFDL